METWYLFYSGDGRCVTFPSPEFIGRTTSKEEAISYYKKLKKDKYNTGYVLVVTDTEVKSSRTESSYCLFGTSI